MQEIKAGTTSYVDAIFIADNAATDGSGKTGILYNAAGLTCYYKRSNGTASVAVTLADITTLGTFVSGGFKQIDSANQKGLYEFHPPDAALASGAKWVVFVFQGASGMAPVILKYILTVTDNQTSIPSQVLDATAASFNTAGTIGNKINSAAAAGDPWVTALPGSYTAGEAGYILAAAAAALPAAAPGTNGGLPTCDANNRVKVKGPMNKNAALSNFEFTMYDLSGAPVAGLTVAATRSIDGGAFGPCANAVSPVANGNYKIDLAASDMNGDVIAFRFTGGGTARETRLTVVTNA